MAELSDLIKWAHSIFVCSAEIRSWNLTPIYDESAEKNAPIVSEEKTTLITINGSVAVSQEVNLVPEKSA